MHSIDVSNQVAASYKIGATTGSDFQQSKQVEKLLRHEKVSHPRILQESNSSENRTINPKSRYDICLQMAAEKAATGISCECNVFGYGIVELRCVESCLYCGDGDSPSCATFSYATNFPEAYTLKKVSDFTTMIYYNGNGNRNEVVCFEGIDCNENDVCDSCRAYVNSSLCNSCSFCLNNQSYWELDKLVVDCENIIPNSSFNDCLAPPGLGVFEALNYDAIQCVIPPPLNDQCTGSTPISVGDLVTGTLIGALADSVPVCQTETANSGVWHTFKGTGTPMLVTTCFGSVNGDTLLNIYQGYDCESLECTEGSYQNIYCSNSYGGGTSVSLATEINKTYFVFVSGRDGFVGPYELFLKAFPLPNNDHCQAAMDLTLNSDSVLGTIVYLSGADRLNVCERSAERNDGEAWYQFVASQNGTLRASTCSGFTMGLTPTITVALGDCENLSCIAESDYMYIEGCGGGGTLVDFDVIAGHSYHVAIWGVLYADVGLFALEIRSFIAVENDLCENAEMIDINSNLTSSLANATLSPDESTGACLEQMNSQANGGIWFSFLGTGDAVIATACSNDFAHFISMYKGSCGGLECVAPAMWNVWDIPKRCSTYDYGHQTSPVQTEAGKLYHILISAEYLVASGNFNLSLRDVVLADNPDCERAIPILPDGQVKRGSTETAMYENFTDTCDYGTLSAGLWYLVVGTGSMMRAHACLDMTCYDAMMSVYSGTCESLNCVGTNAEGTMQGSNTITWATEPLVNYYIRLYASSDWETVDFGLSVSSFQPVVNDLCDGAIALSIANVVEGSMEGGSGYNESFSCFDAFDWPSLWFYIDGTGAALKVSTCSPNNIFTGAMQVYRGTDCSDLVCEDFQDYWSFPTDYECEYPAAAIRFFAEQDMRYFLVLVGLDPNAGANNTFTLSLTEFETTANDICENALPVLDISNAPILGSTSDALKDNMTCGYYYNYLTPGVWYSVIGTGGSLVASTCASELDFGASIFIFSGECGDLECIAYGISGFNTCEQSFSQGSRAIFWTDVNVPYFILVSGGSSPDVGDFSLVIAATVAPPNDRCADAIDLPINGRIIGTNINATGFSGLNYSCSWAPDSPGVWYSLIGTGQVIAISSCTDELNFDAAISVSSGSCDMHKCILTSMWNDMDCLHTRYSAARVVLRTEVGVEYFFAVHSPFDPIGGEFGLKVSTLEAPPNDICSGAVSIQADSGTFPGSITNASGLLGLSYSDMPSVWYSLMGTGDVYAISTCSSELNFDSGVIVFTGPCDSLKEIAYNAYSSCSETFYSTARVVFRTQIGVAYFIAVEGLNYPTQGNFVLALETLEVPPNDECAGALVIQPNTMTISGSTQNATSSGTTNSCIGFNTGRDLWYRVDGTGASSKASLRSERTDSCSLIEIFEGIGGDCEQSCIAVADNYCDGTSEVEWFAELGVAYFIRVSDSGTFELRIL